MNPANGTPRNLVFIGDVHIDRDDPDLSSFLDFLERLAQTSERIILLGDLFNLWLGSADLEQAHHDAVTQKLAELRKRGVVVRYVEGNRDYKIGARHTGGALDDCSYAGMVEKFGGHSIFAVHGDQANRADIQYRIWRVITRSALIWQIFSLLPLALRRWLPERLERRLRKTNMQFRSGFPEAAVRAYCEPYLEAGHDLVVMGHFHVEKDLLLENSGRKLRIVVVPEWKSSRRHLELRPDGEVALVDSR